MAAWRSNLGKHLYSKDNFVAEAAYDVRSALDDAIENSMTAAGQPERMAAWREARDQYRNYLAVEAAIKPDKPHGILGIITPQDLISSVKKQDRRGLVTGRRGRLAIWPSLVSLWQNRYQPLVEIKLYVNLRHLRNLLPALGAA